ncbi:acyltransferase family protein [Butyrivibrio sp. AE2032]|uniref:acyltransferase family protein n=1 Tax=Butyrivibrio sp. AE2032 TaxID=1458463 RepID=UPI0006909425|nr:acyltransferase family protein [Butyrivibrio sp. AE2032]
MKAETKIKNTAGMFDLLKGLTMITIVVVHTLQQVETMGYKIDVGMLGILNVALFVISGYGFRAKNLKKTFAQQFQLLVAPYIITSILTCLMHLICHFVVFGSIRLAIKETIKVFAGLLLGLSDTVQVRGINIFSCGPMWYIWALFWVWIIITLIFNYVPEKWRSVVALAVSVISIALFNITFNPWSIYRGMFFSVFFYSGYYCKKKKLFTTRWDTKYNLLLCASLVAAVLVSYFAGYYHILQFILVPLIIIYPVVLVKIFLALNVFSGPVTNKIRTIGRYSLYFLCAHSLEYIAIPWYCIAERIHSHVGVAIVCVVRLVLDLAICVFVKEFIGLLHRIPLKKGPVVER